MLCKVLYYNKFTHILVVDYEGKRVQFSTSKYKGGQYVDIEKSGNGYCIPTGTAKKVSRQSNKKVKKEEDAIQQEQPIADFTISDNSMAIVD